MEECGLQLMQPISNVSIRMFNSLTALQRAWSLQSLDGRLFKIAARDDASSSPKFSFAGESAQYPSISLVDHAGQKFGRQGSVASRNA
jgi:hypothetical protein